MDYISNNPLSIPHYRTPMEYARHLKKSGKKSGKRNSDSSNDKTTVGLKGKSRDAADKASDADADADPRVKLQRRWKWLHWSLNSNNAGQEESKLLDASSSRPAPSSYQSSEHTVKSENHSPSPSPSRPGSSGKAVSDTEPNDEAALSIKQTANISMPYFHDRPNDFTPFVDQTPLSIATNSPIELVANLLGRLGVSYLAVVEKGVYRGAIFKKAYIGYVKELEEGGYVH
ncbi:hypothetical protein GGI12_006193 [Dipsacomyces acuminosporus]|nr:hypothetical protein GGI12_006193 [Dipsacomyces acuminosporus]